MNATEDPTHPILDRPWEYDIMAFSCIVPLTTELSHTST